MRTAIDVGLTIIATIIVVVALWRARHNLHAQQKIFDALAGCIAGLAIAVPFIHSAQAELILIPGLILFLALGRLTSRRLKQSQAHRGFPW